MPTARFGLMLLCTLALAAPTRAEVRHDAQGWTVLTGNGTTDRHVYVSNAGNDRNSGLSKREAKATLGAAWGLVRDGTGDQLHLRRGDVFKGEPPWNGQRFAGRSAQERIVIDAYSEDGSAAAARPIVLTGNGYGWRFINRKIANVAVCGIDFDSGIVDGAARESHGIEIIAGTTGNLLFEDCVLRRYVDGACIIGDAPTMTPLRGITLRRCQILDNFGKGRPSGLYIENVDGLTIDECLLDGNGWDVHAGVGDTIFNHNLYANKAAANCVIRGTISSRASSHGIATGTQWTIEDNLVLDCPVGIQARPADAIVRNNVVIGTRGISKAGPRGQGMYLLPQWGPEDSYDATPPGPLLVEGNLIVHSRGQSQLSAIEVTSTEREGQRAEDPLRTIRGNIVHDWSAAGIVFNPSNIAFDRVRVEGNRIHESRGDAVMVDFQMGAIDRARVVFDGNWYFSGASASKWFQRDGRGMRAKEWAAFSGEAVAGLTARKFAAPERTVEKWHESIGGEGTTRAFLAAARKNRRGNWNVQYTAPAVNEWMRAGFRVVDGVEQQVK